MANVKISQLTAKGSNLDASDRLAIAQDTGGGTFAVEFNLVENHFYDLIFINGATVVYKDRIFCIDQSVSSFSVNKNQYTANSTTNEFIVYE